MLLRWGGPMGSWRNKFSDLRRVLVLASFIFLLDAVLAWTLDHTDIVASAAVFVVGIGLQAIVIFLLIKPPAAPENDLGGQLSVSDTSANLKNRGEDRKAA